MMRRLACMLGAAAARALRAGLERFIEAHRLPVKATVVTDAAKPVVLSDAAMLTYVMRVTADKGKPTVWQ